MIRKFATGYISLALMLQLSAQTVQAEETPAPYHYSDEWSVVSAPPPAGPYRPVNIDPRVPGPGGVMPMPITVQQPESAPPVVQGAVAGETEAAAVMPAPSTDQQPESAAQLGVVEGGVTGETGTAAAMPEVVQPLEVLEPVPEHVMQHAPAAGMPAARPEPVTPAEAAAAGQARSASRLPVPGQYGHMMPPRPVFNYPAPGRYPYQAGYPGYRNMPPFGYYSAPGYPQETEVPSPGTYEGYRGYGYPR